MRSVIGILVVEGRTQPGEGGGSPASRSGAWLRGIVETSGPRLESDFIFTRFEAEARGYLPVTYGIHAKARMIFGTTGAGTLPFQKEFAVGGISTLRAHPYKHRRGDHLFLANGEVAVQVWRGRERSGVRTDVQAIGFLDVGQAWDGPKFDLARRQMMADAGLGLSIVSGRLSVYAARDLRADDGGVHWTVRLASPF